MTSNRQPVLFISWAGAGVFDQMAALAGELAWRGVDVMNKIFRVLSGNSSQRNAERFCLIKIQKLEADSSRRH